MKKQVVTGIVTAGILAGIFVAPTASHAIDKTTNATVQFAEDDNPTPTPEGLGLVKPGTEKSYIWMFGEGAFTTDTLRFSNVPNINFGKVKIASGQDARYSALISKYQPSPDGKVPAEDNTKKVNIPQFAQIVDGRGENGQFEVKVSATPFTATGKPSLANTRVELYGAVTRNNVLDKTPDANASTLLTSPGIANGTAKTIPTAKASGLSVLKVVTGKSANASISSVVFDKDYTSKTDYSKKTENDQIKLYVPNGEQPQKGVTYTSTLNWELIDSI